MKVVPEGKCPLTEKELEIIKLLAKGLTYQQIAQRSERSVSTIRTHLHHIYGKLGVSNRAHAVLACALANWADLGIGLPSTREERLLAICAQILGDLAEVIKKGRGAASITPTQRRYLQAFDAYLRAGAAEADGQPRTQMHEQLQLVLEEAATDFVALDSRQRRYRRKQTLQVA